MDKRSLVQCGLNNSYEHTVIGNQTRAMMNSGEELDASKHSTMCNTLDLSKKKLHCLSKDLYKNSSSIQNVHLEGNSLCSIPEDFFLHLPYLVWLDIRYNNITCLPSSIGDHRQLQYLLLEGNPIKALPVELGDLTTLRALNLRHCPIEFPPENVVQKGLESILSFLRTARKKEEICLESSEPDLPPIEKLQLTELLDTNYELSEEWGSEEERKRFEILKERIQQEEMKEMLQGQTFGLQARLQGAASPRKPLKCNILTGSRHAVPLEKRRPEADRHAQMKERLALILQKNKDQETLKEWQKQTKNMQDEKVKNSKAKEVKITSTAPYATCLDGTQKPSDADKQERLPSAMSMKSFEEMEKASASRDLKLENRIRQHIQAMQERRRNPKGSAQEELEASKKEMETAALLQGELLQRKREQELLEYRFTAFTGEMSSGPPPQGKLPNIFATTL
ncbi:leucine-rich repeat-containing protein 27 [Discoglossus pictus]